MPAATLLRLDVARIARLAWDSLLERAHDAPSPDDALEGAARLLLVRARLVARLH